MSTLAICHIHQQFPMKVVDVCQTPLLSSEVYALIKGSERNALAFSARDPLENPDITDSDELRRLVAAKRTCGYLENCLSIQDINLELLPEALSVLRSFELSLDLITRLVDGSVLTGSQEGSSIYLGAILRDDLDSGKISADHLDSIRDVLFILTGKMEGSISAIRAGQGKAGSEAAPTVDEAAPPTKRRASSRRK